MKKRLMILIAAALILLSAALVYLLRTPEDSWICNDGRWERHGNPTKLAPREGCGEPINSFDDCAKAGYPIMESYPPQCNTPDGRHFVDEV